MGYTQRNWGSTWMFILWGTLLLASVAFGRTGSGGTEKPRSFNEQARATASFLLGANAAAPTTHDDRH